MDNPKTNNISPNQSEYNNQNSTKSTMSTNQLNNNNNENHNTESNKSFADTVKNNPTFQYPTKEQGILLNSINGVKIKSYISAVAAIVTPKNIIAASRISNNRI